jgi:hypothetical protein
MTTNGEFRKEIVMAYFGNTTVFHHSPGGSVAVGRLNPFTLIKALFLCS